jgi:dihydropyrimidinase
LDTLKDLIEAGVGSVKVFTTYSGLGLSWDQLERVFEVAASHSLTVLAHAETDSIVAAAIDAEVEAGRLAPSGHPRSRPAAAEADAIERLGEMAGRTGAHLYVVHVSSAAGVDALRKLRREGIEVVGETCPQYLFLDSDVYDREDGELWICSPPIRSQTDQAALWSGLADGTLTVVGSDHNCFERSQKETHRHDFREVPNGLPGVEYRLPLLVHAALMGGLDWPDVARLAAETPARVFGLWPRKGVIAVGADADLAIVDPTAETDLGRGHMASDYSPFAHLSARGAIRQVWLRGRPIVDGGKLTVGPGYGRFLATNRG